MKTNNNIYTDVKQISLCRRIKMKNTTMKEMNLNELSNVNGGKKQIYVKRKSGIIYLIDAILKSGKKSA